MPGKGAITASNIAERLENLAGESLALEVGESALAASGSLASDGLVLEAGGADLTASGDISADAETIAGAPAMRLVLGQADLWGYGQLRASGTAFGVGTARAAKRPWSRAC